MADFQIKKKIPLFLHGFFGVKTEWDLKKNDTWCHSGRSSEQNETLNMPIRLVDFCQTCRRGSKMSFWDKHVWYFFILIVSYTKVNAPVAGQVPVTGQSPVC